MNAPVRLYKPSQTGAQCNVAQVFSSWTRVLEYAPVENKLWVFARMAEAAREHANAQRQTAIDAMQLVADESGLTAQVGSDHIQAALAAAFGGSS